MMGQPTSETGRSSSWVMVTNVDVPWHEALQNPKILENILKYCTVTDLKGCRHVSKFWRDTSQKAMSTTTCINLWHFTKMVKFLKFLDEANTTDFIKHFTNFKVMVNRRKPVLYRSFWTRFGEHIKVLDLFCADFRLRSDFENAILHGCPNVEQLHLQSVRVKEDCFLQDDEWKSPDFVRQTNLKFLLVGCNFETYTGIRWIELFSHFPALEILHVISRKRDYAERICDAVATIREEDQNKLKLKEIRGIHTVENVSIFLLDPVAFIGLQPEALSLALKNEKSGEIFQQILSQHGASLKKLELRSWWKGGDFIPENCFPTTIRNQVSRKLDNLEELELRSGVFSNLQFLQFTPNLRKLTIVHHGRSRIIANTKTEDLQNLKLLRCVELKVEGRKITRKEYRKLTELMPNVNWQRFNSDHADLLNYFCGLSSCVIM